MSAEEILDKFPKELQFSKERTNEKQIVKKFSKGIFNAMVERVSEKKIIGISKEITKEELPEKFPWEYLSKIIIKLISKEKKNKISKCITKEVLQGFAEGIPK